jgi:hypothetical protein
MQIQVTQENIDKGTFGNGLSCPVALALQSCIPGDISVGSSQVIINEISYDLPLAVVDFIDDYDQGYDYLGEDFEPFTFELAV